MLQPFTPGPSNILLVGKNNVDEPNLIDGMLVLLSIRNKCINLLTTSSETKIFTEMYDEILFSLQTALDNP